MPSPVAYTPEQIWKYFERGLSVLNLYEGVTSSDVIYRALEFFDSNWVLMGSMLGTGNGGIFLDVDDLIPGATETVLLSGYDPSPIKDYDDTTWDSVTIALNGTTGQTLDIVKYDLGSPKDVIIYFKGSRRNPASGVLIDPVIAVSNDGTTWNDLIEITTYPGIVARFASQIQYIKYYAKVASNTEASTYTLTVNIGASLEVYPCKTLDVDYYHVFNTRSYRVVSMLYDKSSSIYTKLFKVRPI